ncbi:DUF4398 domain-containing protein [Sulfuriferula plumbiphila]|nr:DUF4398 domain-containing protein [Sulfuriferula plumbiphila]
MSGFTPKFKPVSQAGLHKAAFEIQLSGSRTMMRKPSKLKLQPMLNRTGVPALITAIVIMMAGCASVPPPTAQMAVSQAAVDRASSADANEFAPVELQSAKDKLARAERAMVQENYELAQQLAEEAQVDAKLAEAKSQSATARKAAKDSQEAIRVLREEINRKTQ